MAYLTEKIDLYNDRGQVIESGIPLEAVTPVQNPAVREIADTFKRSIAVNLAGAQKALSTGHYANEYIHLPDIPNKADLPIKSGPYGKPKAVRTRTWDVPLVENADTLAAKLKEKLQVDADDGTEVKIMKKGAMFYVKPSQKLCTTGIEYTTALTATAQAMTDLVMEEFDDILDFHAAPLVHTAFYGRYPSTYEFMGGNVISLLAASCANEGPGFALRNLMVNHIVAITRRRTMEAMALSSTLEAISHLEMGDAIGRWRRWQSLVYAYQGLNANNIVYDLVKECGSGTTGDVVGATIGRALEDKVIRVQKTLPSGFKFYTALDPSLWNAYTCAGTAAAVIVNQGAARAAQGVASTVLYFNDMIDHETGLPSAGYADGVGNGISMSFFSHSIYGGGSPGVFHGNHIVTRHSKGFLIPCVAAAVALDAGTAVYGPEATSGLVGDIFSEIDLLREPMESVAKSAAEIKNKF
ncbi:methyl-coenzyme M reductase subunit beta [Methanosarcinales archaeon]|nr:MAG: methyl-coenzyme M reductase subunit beta [Methanosarcinales archaeon]